MNKQLLFVLLAYFNFFIISSCRVEDLNPDGITNEIKVTCFLTDSLTTNAYDTLHVIDVCVSSSIQNCCYDKKFISYGHCWTYNTDSLPTVLSHKREISWYTATHIKDPLTGYVYTLPQIWEPLRTYIPVSDTDTKLIVRGYVTINDTKVRYSDPLVLVNPIQYAN